VTPMFRYRPWYRRRKHRLREHYAARLYMGLSKAEIAKRMDSIVEFTELGEFLSFPVRTYSAGMQARLTFAIATSIEPEILLLDEGIGVGDADFLEKANKRLASLRQGCRHSRCWLLIRKNLIESFCNKAAIHGAGRVTWFGRSVGVSEFTTGEALLRAASGCRIFSRFR